MSYVIETNIPAPRRRDGTLGETFANMLPGDSVLINANSIAVAYEYAKKNGATFTTSMRPEYAPKGKVRVWLLRRVAVAKVQAAA